jgi:hypothetical protein
MWKKRCRSIALRAIWRGICCPKLPQRSYKVADGGH